MVNGVKWCVGEKAKYGNYARQQVTANKANTETLVMLLTGAYLRAPEQSNLFITAIPIKQWTKDVNNPYKVALRKQLLGEYEVSVNNGKSRTIAIDNLDITFEGAGIWFYYVLNDSGNDNPKYSWLRSKKVHVVDLGSRTANYLGIYQEHFTKRDSDTSDNGTLQIRRAKKGKQMTERDIEQHPRAIIADISGLWLEADFNSAVDQGANGATDRNFEKESRWVQGVALTIGAVLGSGVLVLPVLAAQLAGPASLVSWLLMGLLAVPVVATIGNLASHWPEGGGIAAYALRSFGRRAGTATGWLFLGTIPIGGR